MHQIPNLLTLFRVGLVPPLIFALLEHHYRQGFLFFAVAGTTDFLDGLLAKRFSWQSQFGAMVDPLADKILMVSTVLILASQSILPWWVVGLILGRDLIIVSGAIAYRLLIGAYEFSPSLLGKTNTMIQILYLGLVLLQAVPIPWLTVWVDLFLFLVVVSTLSSGVQYVYEWGTRAWQVSTQQTSERQ